MVNFNTLKSDLKKHVYGAAVGKGFPDLIKNWFFLREEKRWGGGDSGLCFY